jgi:transcriptional regulator with XRE-family HTH domain
MLRRMSTERGERIRSARKAAGYRSQTRLAGALGVDISTVSHWELRGRLPEDADMLAKLARTIGVSIDWLITGESTAVAKAG